MNASLPTIDDFMATELVSFAPEDDIKRAIHVLLARRFSGAPVVDKNGQLVGVLSKKDCLGIVYNTAYHQDWGGKVEQYMSRHVEHIEAGSSLVTVTEKFLHSRFRRFPVLREGRLVGQISRHDILRALEELYA